jgi:hypothetical protein
VVGNKPTFTEVRLRMKNPVFQIRSSWTQFLMRERFVRLEKSISYVFSTRVNIPTPPASTNIMVIFAISYG